jgi:hypothetical protein
MSLRRVTHMGEFDGRWKVRREAGLLPPLLRKSIHDQRGWTKLGLVPLLPFRIDGLSFLYRWLPLRDELSLRDDGALEGKGYLFGRRFCRFRLEPA